MKNKITIKDAERILVNFHAWFIHEYNKDNPRHKTILDVVKYYLRKERRYWNNE